ncbi:hypothetical protein AGOR_G00221030 [Albula goreensis]|uniref:Uncharacterized protein n=1 Tax=Albula goreensis TaxID=1534307 RepID=A0A8T3CMY9_9TELE|nr:hypothetical protein AGOR_G00221030 [Albula goreensis]
MKAVDKTPTASPPQLNPLPLHKARLFQCAVEHARSALNVLFKCVKEEDCELRQPPKESHSHGDLHQLIIHKSATINLWTYWVDESNICTQTVEVPFRANQNRLRIRFHYGKHTNFPRNSGAFSAFKTDGQTA